MIDVKVSSQSLWNHAGEGYAFLLEENFEFSSDLKKIETNYFPKLRLLFEKNSFKGKRGEVLMLNSSDELGLVQFLFIGLGSLKKEWYEALEDCRRAVGTLVQSMRKLELQNIALCVPSLFALKIEHAEFVKQIVIVAHFAEYEFTTFKSDRKDKKYNGTLTLVVDKDVEEKAKKAAHEGTIIGKAANCARHWADLPPNILTPSSLSEEAQAIANEYGLVCTIFGREKALQLGMGGFCAVDAGSDQDAKFVVLEYKGASASSAPIALIGKGVTFDSGGISLKPANSMTGMKYDMSGAAAVIATLKAIAQLKPAINVVGITPLVENMPSGKCAKQDDIIMFMNGKTAEIQNTDAEGRLILADALCYAEKNYAPACIIDIATLTGACVVALGHYFTALMSRDEKLSKRLHEVGYKTGERLWRLPLSDDFKAAIKSEVADIGNSGKPGYGAGTVTAGLFLEHFVEKTPWAHLDIAGTGHDVPDINYVGRGASGAGVRLFVEFILNYSL